MTAVEQREETARTSAKFELSNELTRAERRRLERKTSKESPNAKAARKRKEKKETMEYRPADPITPHEANFRHAHWKPKRKQVLKTLRAAGIGPSAIEAFENCGSECSVEYDSENNRYRLKANYCHNRHCEPCMRAKSNTLAKNLEQKVTDNVGKQFRFITLTLKHSDDPLREQLDRLTECFKKLRNSKVWKETQEGGCCMLEVKWNPDTGEWHPHFHIVAEGFFLHHRDLRTEWYKITGDSFRVDIRALDSARDAAWYVGKYVSKGTNNEVWYNEHTAKEWVTAMQGKRTCATYGTWRGFKLLESEPPGGEWKQVGRLEDICRAADRNELWAIKCIDCLKAELQYNPNKKRGKAAKLLAREHT